MLDNLTMRQQAVMEEFLRVFTSMYKASAMSEAIMSNVFEQLVQYQKTETVHATMASSRQVFLPGQQLAQLELQHLL